MISTMLSTIRGNHGTSHLEVRYILRRAVNEESMSSNKLGSLIAARFADVGPFEPLRELRGQSIGPMNFGA
jgi:hypothetical protein